MRRLLEVLLFTVMALSFIAVPLCLRHYLMKGEHPPETQQVSQRHADRLDAVWAAFPEFVALKKKLKKGEAQATAGADTLVDAIWESTPEFETFKKKVEAQIIARGDNPKLAFDLIVAWVEAYDSALSLALNTRAALEKDPKEEARP